MYHAQATSIAALLKHRMFLDWVENLQGNAGRKQKKVQAYQRSICVAIILLRAHSMINCLKWRTLGFDQWQNPGGVQGALTSPFSKIIPSVTYDKIRLLTEEEKENRYKC